MTDNPLLLRLFLIITLLILSAFFSACEAAFFSLHGIQFETLCEKNRRKGELIRNLLGKPRRLLVAIYIGNEIVNVAIAAIITSLMIFLIGESGITYAMVLSLALLLMFGEITPKTYAIRNPERFALFAVFPLKWFTILVSPLQMTLTAIADLFVSSLGIKNLSKEPTVSEEEIRAIIDLSEENGALPSEEKEMIQSVFDLSDRAVSEVMTPRTDTFALEISESMESVLKKISKEFYSRVPVYEKNIDNIVGIFYTKELMTYMDEKEKMPDLRDLLHSPLIIPESRKINEVLNDFLKKKIHQAILLDEHGGVAGVVTMEDLLEELFGEIEGEYRKDEKEVIKIDNYNYHISARMEIREFNEIFGADISNDDFDTIGGFVFHSIGRVPRIGESIEFERYRFTIDKMKGHRVVKLSLYLKPEPNEGNELNEGNEPNEVSL